MPRTTPEFRVPSPVEGIFNRIFGFFVGLGLGFPRNTCSRFADTTGGRFIQRPLIFSNSVASASWSPLAAGHNGFATRKPPEKSR
jgi:hypothetical protein